MEERGEVGQGEEERESRVGNDEHLNTSTYRLTLAKLFHFIALGLRVPRT